MNIIYHPSFLSGNCLNYIFLVWVFCSCLFVFVYVFFGGFFCLFVCLVEELLGGKFLIICKTYSYLKLFGNLTHMTIIFFHVMLT